ncbi:NtaA/DmoA family FMN-dependent monooxygenase [Gordonia amarae]|uniref:NtaA/DmoA family FMN-dependent monooxygenase n=2 Tax=Gordonia amarae TaxID=36821 RepID=A0A857KZR3_9ACTN|nr:NtaA/DmoA family FMN-dependent monooxygenase [Gordonia amarae]MCS3879888.1 FMN-dependent oxidoreductase (nitrilotriacetate monooxygenase family) [Gordonia amarae]QHN18298.1 NtaA/DmoA family FMN-dependent monooxygenase [Gordonia amarae]QHN22781.1 NtaA/DmoA family FMN-dependent monooxygenase [Gordonia amarae]QHN31685.1 NtaA/DmoA family FMN-dependent monooxygenase [Gordonia amarae]QHN40429.1 NtaA/DmoA family FMN-dependent monooxygenase [Gordonia amarae]
MVRQSGVFFVSGEFAFTDRFPSWKQGGSPERRAAGSADFARELDELGFDAIFIADFLGLNRSQVANRSARHFEPLTAASHLAAMTSRIGLVITISTQFTEPYNTARQLNSLDWLSQGRIGWNVVTSFNGERNYGYDAIPVPAERYSRAAEYLSVTKALWNSWAPDAIIRDLDNEVFTDITKVSDIDHRGEHFAVRDALDLEPGPQRIPVIAQAGASERGIDFAAGSAEVVFVATPDIDAGRAYYKTIKDAVRGHGRDPGHLKVLPGLRLYLGDTVEEAEAAYYGQLTDIDLERAKTAITYEVPGLDLSGLGPDDEIPLDRFPAPEAIVAENRRVSRALIYRNWVRDGVYPTLRRFLVRYATSFGHFQIVGTAADAVEQITDWVTTGASDGFILLGGSSFDRIRDDVLPGLVDRGVFARDHAGATLRERLGTSTPGLPDGEVSRAAG